MKHDEKKLQTFPASTSPPPVKLVSKPLAFQAHVLSAKELQAHEDTTSSSQKAPLLPTPTDPITYTTEGRHVTGPVWHK